MGIPEKELEMNAAATQHHENELAKTKLADEAVIIPESLRGMSPEELRVLERKMVRKMDMVIVSLLV